LEFCKQDATKSGHTCLEHSPAADLIASRSALANTGTSLASTLGAKPGMAITDAPRSAKIPKAANDLIILKLLTWFFSYPSTLGDQRNNNHSEKEFHMRNQWFG
jgi:hypothetical protein